MNSDHSLFNYMIDKRNKANRTNDIKYNNEYSHVALFSTVKIKKGKCH
jgi:hypothetical protein